MIEGMCCQKLHSFIGWCLPNYSELLPSVYKGLWEAIKRMPMDFLNLFNSWIFGNELSVGKRLPLGSHRWSKMWQEMQISALSPGTRNESNTFFSKLWADVEVMQFCVSFKLWHLSDLLWCRVWPMTKPVKVGHYIAVHRCTKHVQGNNNNNYWTTGRMRQTHKLLCINVMQQITFKQRNCCNV